jgi:hypothetical protein
LSGFDLIVRRLDLARIQLLDGERPVTCRCACRGWSLGEKPITAASVIHDTTTRMDHELKGFIENLRTREAE